MHVDAHYITMICLNTCCVFCMFVRVYMYMYIAFLRAINVFSNIQFFFSSSKCGAHL